MDYSDIKENDLVCFDFHVKDGCMMTKKGYVLSTQGEKTLVRWFGQNETLTIVQWNMTIINLKDADSLNLMKIGTAKYPTIYRPAFFGLVGTYGFVYFFGSFITGILGTIALGFGGALAFILAKNFKRIKNFKIKKNVTILSPVKEEDKPEFVTKSQIKDVDLKLIK